MIPNGRAALLRRFTKCVQNNCRRKSTWTPVQRDLLQGALSRVPQFGWTTDAIAAAAAEKQQSIALTGLVTVPALVAYCMDEWKERLRRELAAREQEERSSTIQRRIAHAMELRLRYQQEFLSQWPQAMVIGLQHISTTREQLEELIAVIVQDEPQQLSSLARISLGSIYVATELHMLADTSPDFADTWIFLSQQLEAWAEVYDSSSTTSSLPNAMWLTSTSLATAALSGAASVLQQTPTTPSSVFKSSFTKEDAADGTDPSHYEEK